MFGVTGTGSFGPPQNSDVFAVDDTLSELEKCKRYVVSKLPLQRFVYVKCLASCAREIGVDSTIKDVLPLLDQVLTDSESFIRTALGEELAKLTFYLAYPNLPVERGVLNKDGILEPIPLENGGEDPSSIVDVKSRSYQEILNTITPAIQRLIGDSLLEVRQSASRALAQVAAVLHGDDVGKTVLTLVLCLAHAEGDEQRTTAVHLMNELAPQLGQILCQNFIALELAAFADDSTFRVRKATAQSFGNVCQTAGDAFTVQKLLPPYQKLSKDLMWGVRKGCVDSMVSVAKVVPPAVRTEVFIPMFERFAGDTSRWVRNGAFEVLGSFLHTLGSESISKEFLQYFTNIPTMSDTVVDQEVKYCCSFNFPAVTLTLGKERWNELVDCFTSLCSAPKFHVRKCMACSLHEIAAIIGEEAAEKCVLPQVERFLKDINVVRTGVIKNLAAILKCVPHAAREPYLNTMWNLHNQREPQHWRWRWHLARQMGELLALYSTEIVTTTLRPLLFEMCADTVAAVRAEACAQVGCLLARLSKDKPDEMGSTVEGVCKYYVGINFMERQMFIRCCQGCSAHLDDPCVLSLFDAVAGGAVVEVPSEGGPEVVTGAFWSRLSALEKDRVPNIRTSLATCLNELLKAARSPATNEFRDRLVRSINILRNDSDEDVAIIAKKLDLAVWGVGGPTPPIKSSSTTSTPRTSISTATNATTEPPRKEIRLTDKDLEDMGLVDRVEEDKSSLFEDDDDDKQEEKKMDDDNEMGKTNEPSDRQGADRMDLTGDDAEMASKGNAVSMATSMAITGDEIPEFDFNIESI